MKLLLLYTILVSSIVWAGHVIQLKNGQTIFGEITAQELNQSVTIRLSDGSTKTLSWTDIEGAGTEEQWITLQKEKALKANSVTPEPAPLALPDEEVEKAESISQENIVTEPATEETPEVEKALVTDEQIEQKTEAVQSTKTEPAAPATQKSIEDKKSEEITSDHVEDLFEQRMPGKKPKKARNFYAGILLGTATGISPSSGDSSLIYGGRIGFGKSEKEKNIFSFGLVLQGSRSVSIVNGITIEMNYAAIAGELLSRRMFGTGLYMGARAGGTFITADLSAGTASTRGTAFSYIFSPVVGSEFRLGRLVSLVLDISWLNMSPGTLVFPTASYNYDSSSYLIIQTGINFNW